LRYSAAAMADTLKVDAAPGDASAPTVDDPASRVGTMIASKYALARVIGTGGMGAVYEAENTWTGRRVALKLMHPSALKVATAAERFLREARAASKVQHTNIVEVFDAGQNPSDGALFIVQELLRGTDLRARLDAKKTLSWTEAMAVIGPVLEALAVAHRQGVIHRDVKPENIYLAETASGCVPKLIDFGIARVLDGDGAMSLTRSGALMGTPYYMSPEQARGLRDVDARADVWAVAIVLYESLTGRRPFEGSNYNALLVSILQDRIAPIAERAPELAPHVAAAIDRALSRDPAKRFSDAGEFLDALRATDASALAQTAPGTTVIRRAPHRKRTLGAVFVAGASVATLLLSAMRPDARRTTPETHTRTPMATAAVMELRDAPPPPPPPPPVVPIASPTDAGVAPLPRTVRRVVRRSDPRATPLIRSLNAQ
jgi:serine/threonine protein kinase